MGLAIIVPNVSFADVNLGKVTLSGDVPIRGIYINLEDSYAGTAVDLKCSYLPANTTQRNVIWSIENGDEYASIVDSVLYISQGATNNEVTIKCTNVSNPSIYATKLVHVTYQAGDLVILEGRAIATDSNAYINVTKDFTGEKRFNTTASDWELVARVTTPLNTIRCIFGGNGNSGNFGTFIRQQDSTYHSNLRVPLIDFNYDIVGKKITVKNVKGSISIEYDGQVVETQNVSGAVTTVGDIALGGRINEQAGTGTIDLYALDIEIYSFKLSTSASGEICDLVPCIYKGTVGMYNKTTQEIMLPETGTFTLV